MGCGLLWVSLGGCATTKVIAAEPASPVTIVATANDFLQAGVQKYYRSEYGQALADLEIAAKMAPDNPSVLSARAMAKSALKDYQGAYADFQQALKLSPDLPRIYYSRGLALRQVGDFYGSLQDFDRAIALKPDFIDAYNSRGVSYAMLNEYPDALRDYTLAIELNPRFGNAFLNRGYALRRMGNYAEALLDLNIAVGLLKTSPVAFAIRGNLFRNMKEYDRARADFLSAQRLQPEMGDAYIGLGRIALHEGKLEQACAEISRGIERDPQYPPYYLIRGMIHEGMNDDLKAAMDYQKAAEMEQNPRSPENELYARLYWNLLSRRTAKAGPDVHLTELRDFGDLWPDPIVAFITGKRSEGAILADAKRRRWPQEKREGECEALYFIGMSHLLAGRTEVAASYFERCLATGLETLCEYSFAKFRLESLRASRTKAPPDQSRVKT